jgi:hypothetical protein
MPAELFPLRRLAAGVNRCSLCGCAHKQRYLSSQIRRTVELKARQ